jgi:hypothetical protein
VRSAAERPTPRKANRAVVLRRGTGRRGASRSVTATVGTWTVSIGLGDQATQVARSLGADSTPQFHRTLPGVVVAESIDRPEMVLEKPRVLGAGDSPRAIRCTAHLKARAGMTVYTIKTALFIGGLLAGTVSWAIQVHGASSRLGAGAVIVRLGAFGHRRSPQRPRSPYARAPAAISIRSRTVWLPARLRIPCPSSEHRE